MRKLESLDAFKCAKSAARSAYRLTLVQPLRQHYALSAQIRRSAVSIPANIVEGYVLGTRAQFVRYLRIALGSAAELSVHLELVEDMGLADSSAARAPRELSDRTVAVITGLLKSLGARPARTLPAPRSPLPDQSRAGRVDST